MASDLHAVHDNELSKDVIMLNSGLRLQSKQYSLAVSVVTSHQIPRYGFQLRHHTHPCFTKRPFSKKNKFYVRRGHEKLLFGFDNISLCILNYLRLHGVTIAV